MSYCGGDNVRVLFMTCIQQVVLQAIIPVHELEIVLDILIAPIGFPLLRAEVPIEDGFGGMVEIRVRLCSSVQGGFGWSCRVRGIGWRFADGI